MSRSKWKGPFISSCLTKKNSKVIKQRTKIWSRNSIISSNFIDKLVLIYNGKEFKSIFINREKVGFKFGQFVSTRNKNKFKKKKTIKKK